MRLKTYHRRGVSLLELVILIGAGAVLFGLAIVAFARVLAVRRVGEDHLNRTTQTARLAEQLRRDVWASKQATQPPGKANELLLDGDNRQVEYEFEGNSLRRTLLKGEEPLSRETFQLPGATPLRFEIGSASVTLLIAPLNANPVEGEDPRGKPLRISATVARDKRFQSPPEAP